MPDDHSRRGSQTALLSLLGVGDGWVNGGGNVWTVLDEHDSPPWCDIVHFEHKSLVALIWASPKRPFLLPSSNTSPRTKCASFGIFWSSLFDI